MKRLAILVLVVLTAVAALALAQTPKHPTTSSSPLVSIGQPIAPQRIGTPPRTGLIEMRAEDPDGGRARAVLFHRFRKERHGRRLLHVCATPGYERELRRRPVPPFGNCTTPEDPRRHQPFLLTYGSGTYPNGRSVPVQLVGLVDETVTRLVLEGPGGTYEVPRSAHGAFLVLYSSKARGNATLTAHFRDGHTEFREVRMPLGLFPLDRRAASARDPHGHGDWSIVAHERPMGTLAGQTCAQFRHLIPDISAPMCGDLRRHAVFADVTRWGPTRAASSFGPTPRSLRRVILWGAAARGVRAVRAAAGGEPARELPLAEAGRAFIAVYPRRVDPATIRLEVDLADGTTQTFTAPDELNVTRLRDQPRLRGRVSAGLDGPLITLRARLGRPARAFRISFYGRRIVMRREGAGLTYSGVYDRRRGKRRTVRSGRRYPVTLVLCGPEGCVSSVEWARASSG